MKQEAKTIDDILTNLPHDREKPFKKLHEVITQNLPSGFEPAISYGMLSYVVPLSLYPAGYHCKAGEPLPFVSIASQKNFISLYHMGLYADPELMNWFLAEYRKHSKQKLDIGKSCIRFKKPDDIPYEFIGELIKKMPAEKWIGIYEEKYRK